MNAIMMSELAELIVMTTYCNIILTRQLFISYAPKGGRSSVVERWWLKPVALGSIPGGFLGLTFAFKAGRGEFGCLRVVVAQW